MKNFHPKPKADGWIEWQTFDNHTNNLSCCDCGLTHTFEYRIEKTDENGKVELPIDDTLPPFPKGYTIIFRARRNERSTGQVRRWRKQ